MHEVILFVIMLLAASALGFRSRMTRVSMMSMMSGSTQLKDAIFLQGQVTHGYGRGSKKLGVPTANLPHFDSQLSENGISQGVYYGWTKLYGMSGKAVPCVANIGKSPTFEGQENAINIVEVHLIEPPSTSDFYGDYMRVALVGFLRPEIKFESFDALVKQINQDVKDAAASCVSADSRVIGKTEEFLSSDFESDPIKLRSLMKMCQAQIDEKLGGEMNPRNLKTLWGLVPI